MQASSLSPLVTPLVRDSLLSLASILCEPSRLQTAAVEVLHRTSAEMPDIQFHHGVHKTLSRYSTQETLNLILDDLIDNYLKRRKVGQLQSKIVVSIDANTQKVIFSGFTRNKGGNHTVTKSATPNSNIQAESNISKYKLRPSSVLLAASRRASTTSPVTMVTIPEVTTKQVCFILKQLKSTSLHSLTNAIGDTFYATLPSVSERLTSRIPMHLLASCRSLATVLSTIVEDVITVEANLEPSRRNTIRKFIKSVEVQQNPSDSSRRSPPNTSYLNINSYSDNAVSAPSTLTKVQAYLEQSLTFLQRPVILLAEIVKNEISEVVADAFREIKCDLSSVMAIREVFIGTCLFEFFDNEVNRCILDASFAVYRGELSPVCDSITRPTFRKELSCATVLMTQCKLSRLFTIVHGALFEMVGSRNYSMIVLLNMLFVWALSVSIIDGKQYLGSQNIISQIQFVENVLALHAEITLRIDDLTNVSVVRDKSTEIPLQCKDLFILEMDQIAPRIQSAFASLHDIKIQLIIKHVTNLKLELDTWLTSIYSKETEIITLLSGRKISHMPSDVLAVFEVTITLAAEKFGSALQDAYILTISAVCQSLRMHQTIWFQRRLEKQNMQFEDWLLVFSDCQELSNGIELSKKNDLSKNNGECYEKLGNLVETLATIYQSDMMVAVRETIRSMFYPIRSRDADQDSCLYDMLLGAKWEDLNKNEVSQSMIATIEDFWADLEVNAEITDFFLAKALALINVEFVTLFLRRFVERCTHVRVGDFFTVKPFMDPAKGSELLTTDINICEQFTAKRTLKLGLKSISEPWQIMKLIAQMVESATRLYDYSIGLEEATMSVHINYELGPLAVDLTRHLVGKTKVGLGIIKRLALAITIDAIRIAAPCAIDSKTASTIYGLVKEYLDMEEEKRRMQQGLFETDASTEAGDAFDLASVIIEAYSSRAEFVGARGNHFKADRSI